ncbi:MAG: aminotransferase class V-fold PLP-dependent enzyme [Firmicutes bacterium]|nr:aminotransferase class V-fold PLP-dependent enzyme [Bacillota bacterium]
MKAIYEKYGLTPVINARSSATLLGAAQVGPYIREVVADSLGLSFAMAELQKRASQEIASFTGAEAGCVTACTAAGLSVAVAACITGRDPHRIKELPRVEGLKDEVVIEKGHVISAGDAPMYQVVRITGATLIEVGEAADCGVFQLEASLMEQTACALYVITPRSSEAGLIDLETFIEVCHSKDVPVIVDAADGRGLREIVALGADIVIASGHKWICGPTSGILAGRKELIQACYMQEMGIGRMMKAGKESVIGVIAALEVLKRDGWAGRHPHQRRLIEMMVDRLSHLKGLRVASVSPLDSPAACWLRVDVDGESVPFTAWQLTQQLEQGIPSIKTHDYDVRLGYFHIEPFFLSEDDAQLICSRLEEAYHQLANQSSVKAEAGSRGPTRLDRVADIYRTWLGD